MNTRSHYDVAIIGAGMSGLAAGIRLAHFGRRVCIFERHNAVGGLNSFYSLGGRRFDVGLHAMTNYVRPGVKGTPLGKLLRQLRIEREEFALCEQKQSRVAFGARGEVSLRFTNEFAVLEAEVSRTFPAQIDGFRALVGRVRTFDDVSLDTSPIPARAVVRQHITDSLLEDMLFLRSGTPELFRNTDIQSELARMAQQVEFDWIVSATQRLGELESGMRRNLLRTLALDTFATALER